MDGVRLGNRVTGAIKKHHVQEVQQVRGKFGRILGLRGKRRRRRIEIPLSEEDHEKNGISELVWSCRLLAYFDDSGITMTIEQVVTQVQQEAQVADQTGLADQQSATNTNSLATAQVRKDTPSNIDVKGLGHPKEFAGKDEDFPQWSEKTQAYFCRCDQGVRDNVGGVN